MEPILWVVIGFISGTVAGAIVPGRSPGGWLGAVALGVVVGTVGGWLAKMLGLRDTLTWLGSLAAAFLGSVVILIAARPHRSRTSI